MCVYSWNHFMDFNKHLDGYLVLDSKKMWRIIDYIFYDKRVNVRDSRNSRKVDNYLLMRFETPNKSWTSMLWFKHANLNKLKINQLKYILDQCSRITTCITQNQWALH
jgi:hypothetical protein